MAATKRITRVTMAPMAPEERPLLEVEEDEAVSRMGLWEPRAGV